MGKADKTDEVDRFMAELEHPFAEGVEMLRAHIKATDAQITEQVKWKAPSFSYRGAYLTTFNLWSRKDVFLVFHNPHIVSIDSEHLTGDYPDRRLLFFTDLADAEAKKPEVRRIIRELIKMIDN
jgi:hypothetical protein